MRRAPDRTGRPPAARGLGTPPPGWGGTGRGVSWKGLPVERRARVWASFLGVDPAAIAAGTHALVEDRAALGHLLRLVSARREHLAAAGAPTGDADALLAKLQWEAAALGDAVALTMRRSSV